MKSAIANFAIDLYETNVIIILNQMKSIKLTVLAALSFALSLGFASCNDEDDPEEIYPVILSGITDFNESNYWSKCYDTAAGDLVVSGVAFSHQASAFEWEGVTYYSWEGFCPSKVNDTTEHADSWTENQWACISENPNGGVYLVGYSGANVSENPIENTTCTLELANGGYFKPKYIYLNNSSYTYYCAKNGSYYNEPFSNEDWLTLNIVGVRNGALTAQLKAPLIAQGQYLDQWVGVSIEELGTVDKVLFYVDSSDKGDYGLNVPAYFCIADFGYSLPETSTAK